ncbi:MAG TPA: amino acid transport protein [Thermoanaerobaculia bacterium]|nr:amino acid transport protein [Thermoanaerobaculia bacterium]
MTLFLGLIFGGVGTVYLYIAKKEHDPFFLIVGVALVFYPYFFDNILLIVAIGLLLSLAPLARSKGWI